MVAVKSTAWDIALAKHLRGERADREHHHLNSYEDAAVGRRKASANHDHPALANRPCRDDGSEMAELDRSLPDRASREYRGSS